MAERDDILADLCERARYYATLTSLGLPPSLPSDPRATVATPGWSDAPPAIAPPAIAPPATATATPASARPASAPPASARPASAPPASAPPASAPPATATPATATPATATPAIATPAIARVAASVSATVVTTVSAVAPTAGATEGPADLEGIRAWIGDCQRCKLASGRKNIVFGQGNPHASLMFVGEGPGADEDEQGLAFVGRAGQLLTDIIEKGLKMPRGDVWIGNVIKCRPPQNRNPEPDEILACQPFLERQIEVIRPKVIVGLGKFAGQWLLKTAEPISRIRGRVGDYHGIKAVPTWHPAYLLRNPSAKKDVWEDMKLVMRLLAE